MTEKGILVVEDEPIIAADISCILRDLGYEAVFSAVSGEEAIKKAFELSPNLVLMDIVLQGTIDGITAAKQIFDKFSIPVIYLTSHSDAATIRRAKESGPFGYLLKPFSKDDLNTAIEMAIGRHDVERKLKEREQWLSTTLRSIGDAVVVSDARGRIEYMNSEAERLTGWDFSDAVGKSLSEVFVLFDEGTRRKVQDPVSALLGEGAPESGKGEGMLQTGEGYLVPIEHNAASIKDDQGRITGAVLIFHDIVDRKRAVKALEDSERFLSTIFNSIYDPFCILDSDFRILKANEGYARLKGMPFFEMYQKACHSLFEGRDAVCDGCVVAKTFASGDPCSKEKFMEIKGVGRWLEIYTYPIVDSEGRVTHVIEYTRDITERKIVEEDRRKLIKNLEHLSRVDSLTGILNRRALMESLMQDVKRAERYRMPLSLILCDIDRFKEINDTLGHAAGDRALEAVAQTLRGAIRKSDVLGRYGGDEFMVILPGTSLVGAEAFAERMRQAVEQRNFAPSGQKGIAMSLSLGVSTFRPGMDTSDSLIKKADDALYESKRMGRNKITVNRP